MEAEEKCQLLGYTNGVASPSFFATRTIPTNHVVAAQTLFTGVTNIAILSIRNATAWPIEIGLVNQGSIEFKNRKHLPVVVPLLNTTLGFINPGQTGTVQVFVPPNQGPWKLKLDYMPMKDSWKDRFDKFIRGQPQNVEYGIPIESDWIE